MTNNQLTTERLEIMLAETLGTTAARGEQASIEVNASIFISVLTEALASRNGSQALQDVAAERQRQISAEGWGIEHDDEHAPGQLSDAGGCYALNAFEDDKMREGYEPDWWPWERHWYKPGTPRRDLVKAAALIIAEIEHLDRSNDDE